MSDGEQPPENTETDPADAGSETVEFQFPALTKPKVAIVGFALGTVHKAPYSDDGVEKWGLNQLWKITDKKFDRWFELHSLYDFYHANPGHQQFLRDFAGPVYVREEDYALALEWGITTAQPFPHRVLLEHFRPYFTNTISWLIALAIAVGNRVLMMQYSVYAVISPEGCAAILWNDGAKGPQAAEALKLTAQDVDSLGTVIDDVIPEPVGGAHQDHKSAAAFLKESLLKHLLELEELSPDELIEQRYQRFRAMSEIEKPED